MRVTIEIADNTWIQLKKLAAERGLRGYSALVDEALATFLDGKPEDAEAAKRKRQIGAIYAAAGTLSEAEADVDDGIDP